MKYVGPHVSIQGGVENAPINAHNLGAKGFGLFTKNQRQWSSPPLSSNSIEQFKANCKKFGYTADMILPHDSYLINLGQPDDQKLERSRQAFLDEMERCDALGLKYLNFHPGSHLKEISIEECLERIATSLNWVLSRCDNVIAVLENTAGQGSNVGNSFEELAQIIQLVDNKDRVGVCLDTCHTFAAGYDLRTSESYAQVTAEFDRLIGFDKLCGLHLNDSKGDFAKHLDRHAPLGEGTLGIEVFKHIMQDSRIDEIPLVLETPDDSRWADEVKLLYSFC